MSSTVYRLAHHDPWPIVFGLLNGASMMLDSHLARCYLYGLLVIESGPFSFELDILGYDAYF